MSNGWMDPFPPFSVTWQPSPGFEPYPESPDNPSLWDPSHFGQDSFPWTTGVSSFTGRPVVPSYPVFKRRPGNGLLSTRNKFRRESPTDGKPEDKVGRDAYWSINGPRKVMKKVSGSTIEVPVLAPYPAPPEDKKPILTMAKDAYYNAGTSDWANKANMFAQHFLAVAPNAANETTVTLAKMEDFTSDIYQFGFGVLV